MSFSNNSDVFPDHRMISLQQWLSTLTSPVVNPDTIRPASSDASFRRYFRVDAEGGSYIAMDAPPMHEDVRPFIHVSDIFRDSKVSVPEIIAQDTENGFLLLTDFGSEPYLNQLNDGSVHELYMDAIDSLIRIQINSKPGVLPEYDRTLLLREMHLFPDWYIEKHLQVKLTPKQTEDLQKVFDVLVANNIAQPQVYVHRDYHSRNLMILEIGNPGIIDFQDAVYGPITYDLVSLLRDAYITWSEEKVLDWTIRYWETARRAGLPINPDIDLFYRDFEFMGLQRHLKVLGIFARLYHRDHKDAYLKDLPRVLDYAHKTASRYKELAPLANLLDHLQDKKPEVGYTF